MASDLINSSEEEDSKVEEVLEVLQSASNSLEEAEAMAEEQEEEDEELAEVLDGAQSASNSQEEDANDDESMGSFGEAADGEEQEEEVPVLEISHQSLQAPSGHTAADGTLEEGEDLTEESSSSEYEEDLFPEEEEGEDKANEDRDRGESGDDEEEVTEDRRNDFGSSIGGSALSSRSLGGGQSVHSVNVSAAVWARTWEDRIKDFEKNYKEEYQAIEKKMKQKEITHIENERSQRIFENKLFKNVDSIFKILGGAVCALFCCTILIIIIMATIMGHSSDAPPAPTVPPEGSITTAPTMLRATPAPTTASEPTVAPTVFTTSVNQTVLAEQGNGGGGTIVRPGKRLRV